MQCAVCREPLIFIDQADMKETCGRWRRHWQARIHKQPIQSGNHLDGDDNISSLNWHCCLSFPTWKDTKVVFFFRFVGYPIYITSTYNHYALHCRMLMEHCYKQQSPPCVISGATDGRKKGDKKAWSRELNLPHIHPVNQATDQNHASMRARSEGSPSPT